jgi:nucleoside-diphosphate-sugar epimerase
MSVHVVTGATGFVGSAIILELLRQTDVEILGIVRPGTQGAEERLQQAIEQAGRAYGYSESLLQAAKKRCHALPGDLNADYCGVPSTFQRPIEEFWHCAASLQYENRHKTEIYATNLTGTLHALDLARRLGLSGCFNYVSTAYVAGSRVGLILEEPETEKLPNNHYEASKIATEEIILHTTDLATRILRPSIVVGHSRTFAVAQSFSGMYGFMRKLLQFKGATSRVRAGWLQEEALKMRADGDVLVNLVPVDMVARQAVQIAYSSSTRRIFHLTNATPPDISLIFNTMFQEAHMKEPVLVTSDEDFSWIDKQFGLGIDFYQSYLVGHKTFARQNTDAAIGDCHAGQYLFDTPTMLAYHRWYLDLLSATRPRLLATR